MFGLICTAQGPLRHSRRGKRGYTLLELLAVITIISLFAGLLGLALRDSGRSTVSLQSAQTTVATLLSYVRGQAAIQGRNAALLVNASPTSTDRFMRYLVPVLRNSANTAWEPLSDGVFLPAGVYLVSDEEPVEPSIEDGADWSGLGSTALKLSENQPINSGRSEDWIGVSITPRGTATVQGQIVIATGYPQPGGATVPFIYANPENVRGMAISLYGLTRMVNDREGF